MGTKPGEGGSPKARFAKIRANPAGRLIIKIGVGVLGALVIALGLILIPLPGPGWAIVILGLAIWAVEYTWARRLLTYTKRHLRQWTHWIATRAWPTRAALGLTSLAVTAGIIWSSVRLTLGVDLTDYLDLTGLTADKTARE